MNLAELPVYKVKRVMSEAEATELVGTTVPEAEANCNKEGIWIDEDTEEIIFVYFPMEQEVNLLRAAVLNINYGETIRQSTGLKNKSKKVPIELETRVNPPVAPSCFSSILFNSIRITNSLSSLGKPFT